MLSDTHVADEAGYAASCEDGRRLWQHMLKLRWLSLEEEAASVAAELGARRCGLPLALPPRVYPTD